MTEISQRGDVVTLINVFSVAPEDQQRLLDLLVEAIGSVMNELPGFLLANLHKSLDGTRVVSHAQWQSREAFEAMLVNSEAHAHTKEAGKIAQKIGPYPYVVSFIYEAPSSLKPPLESPMAKNDPRYYPGAVPF